MLWLPWKPGGDDEAGLKLARLQPGRARGPRRLVPWWVRAMRRAKAAGVTPTTEDQCGRWRPAAARGAIAHVWAAQRGQGILPAQSGQRRLGQARALSGARACPARDERGRGFDAARESRYGGDRARVGAR